MAPEGVAITTFVALLRGINVGGHNKVPMKELKALCLELGLQNPRTVGASGNLIFESNLQSTAELSNKLELSVKKAFDVGNRIFVLSAAEFDKVLKADPIDPSGRDGDKLIVMFVDKPVTPTAQEEFLKKHQGPEVVEFGARAVYIYYSDGQGRSKLDLSKTLPEPGTARNRNTLKKIVDLLPP